ncbi:hypothetical protein [Streptomyces sp. NPDC050738]|uniref:hypothetical protein n=1 Tax=Streptomyces sp. NPDC050738 TaxID=3154744 RepID=UPI00342BB0C7
MSGGPEPVWLVAANVVLHRRYGEGGQELRPGTKSYRGGAKVYVIGGHPGMGWEQVTTVGHGRHTGAYITMDMAARNLHGFRAELVYSPAVLRRNEDGWLAHENREQAAELAEFLERMSRRYRATHWGGAPHPEPCLCHDCLTQA